MSALDKLKTTRSHKKADEKEYFSLFRSRFFYFWTLVVFVLLTTVFPCSAGNLFIDEDYDGIKAALSIPPAVVPDRISELPIYLHNSPGVQFLGYIMALEEGEYNAAGLPTVKIRWLDETMTGVGVLRSGEAAFGTVWLPRAYCYFSLKSDIVAIAQVAQRSSAGVLVRTDLHPEVKNISDLSGMRVGLFFRGKENALTLSRSENINFTPVFHRSDGLDLLRKGVIDALCVTTYGPAVILKHSKYRNSIRYLKVDSELKVSQPEDALVCSKPFLLKHPNVCKKFIEATYRGWRRVIEDPETALKHLERYYQREGKTFDLDIAREQLAEWLEILQFQPRLENNGDFSKADFHQMRATMLKAGLIPPTDPPEYEEFFYPILRPETMARIERENEIKELAISGKADALDEKERSK